MMKLLDSLTVYRPGDAPKQVELYRGDLSALEPGEAVDVLVVSAFRGNYYPSPVSMIGALLHKQGISVADLARDKAVDLRDYFSCWLSRDLTGAYPRCGFKRLLCFEPETDAHEVVGHLFQALAPFLGGKTPLSTVAMPLIATRAMGASVHGVLTRLIDEAVSWMSFGFPLRRLKIVEYDRSQQAGEAAAVFAEVKRRHSRWDVFISYSHQDREAADELYDGLRSHGLRVFRDSTSLVTGTAWWDEIRNAIRTAGYFVPLYSSDYLRSDTCMSEFSIALASGKSVLFPICLCAVADLPAFMTHNHMEVCPKGDRGRLRDACKKLVSRVRATSP
jgi:TIR domain